MEKKRFYSKIDTWLGILLALIPLISVGTSLALFFSKGVQHLFVGLGSLVVLVVVYGGLIFPLYYEFEETGLLIRSGWLRSRISYASIHAVSPSSSMLSSPALSLDRLHIEFQGSSFGALISPKEKEEFLQALAQRCPHLHREGSKLIAA